MSRVTQKAIQAEEVVSLRQQFQMSWEDGSQTAALGGGKGGGRHTLAQDIEGTRTLLPPFTLLYINEEFCRLQVSLI